MKKFFLLFLQLLLATQVWAAADNIDTSQSLATRPSLFEQRRIEREQGQLKPVDQETAEPSVLAKMLQGLGICIGFLLIGAFAFKKFTRHATSLAGGPHIKILEKVSLSAKTSLVLAVVDNQRVLLGVGTDGVCIQQLFTNNLANSSTTSKSFEQNLELLCVGQKD